MLVAGVLVADIPVVGGKAFPVLVTNIPVAGVQVADIPVAGVLETSPVRVGYMVTPFCII